MRINQKTDPGVRSKADSVLEICLIFMKNPTNCVAEITAKPSMTDAGAGYTNGRAL